MFALLTLALVSGRISSVRGLYEDLGDRIKVRRKAGDLSQAQLAERVELTRTSISNIESGRQHVPLDVLYRVARALNCRPHELLPDPGELAEQNEMVTALAAKTDRDDVREFLSSIRQDQDSKG